MKYSVGNENCSCLSCGRIVGKVMQAPRSGPLGAGCKMYPILLKDNHIMPSCTRNLPAQNYYGRSDEEKCSCVVL